jgi:hypothetical protein
MGEAPNVTERVLTIIMRETDNSGQHQQKKSHA